MAQGVAGSILPIIRREDLSLEAFRAAAWGRVFNARQDDRLPRAIVQATEPAHVVGALHLAIENQCRISVRSGGHSWAAWSVREDAILVDLGGLKSVKYHENTEVVECSPSLTGRELNDFLGQYGRMFHGGHCPDVGLGGFLLQGGMGWNCRGWGWACESIVGADVVTADGTELHCSTAENEDLFWAARGAGPGFPAIVTRFHLLTRPRPSMLQSLYFYPLSAFKTVLRWVIDVSARADLDMEIVCVSAFFPDREEIQILANFLTFKAHHADGSAALQTIHDSRPLGAFTEVFCKDTDLAEQYAGQRMANPMHHRYASDNAYIRNEADIPAALEEAFSTLPTRKSCALYFAMNPCSRRGQDGPPRALSSKLLPLPDMALSMQSDHYFSLYTVWEDAKDDDRCINWVKGMLKGCERESVGSYLGDADFRQRQSRYWGEEAGQRLMEVRRRWDPEGRIAGFLGPNGGPAAENPTWELRNRFEWE